MVAVAQRQDLAEFLRARRESLDPVTVGLPPGGRRRTPGLRREEVAVLAGVSVTWYTWLEQARDIGVSRQVLGSVARALRMDDTERRYLFDLAGLSVPSVVGGGQQVDRTVQQLVETLDPNPAYVVGRWWDLLTYNDAYNALAGGLDDVSAAERNIVWLMVTDPAMRRLFQDWEAEVDRLVGQLRAQLGHFPDDPRGAELLGALKESGPDFVRLWDRRAVGRFRTARKSMNHPVAGRLELDYLKLQAAGDDQQVIVFLPADEITRSRLQELRVPRPATSGPGF